MFTLDRSDLKHSYSTTGDLVVTATPQSEFRRDDESDVIAMITRVIKHFAIKFPTPADIHYLEDAIQAMPEDLACQGDVFRHLVTKLTGERLRSLKKR
ncbi:MAG: hypothetical protein R6W92_11955 [Desulfocurvibacter africanus]